MTWKDAAAIAVAIGIGCAVGFVDSRPNWDDTGVTVGLLVLTALVLACIRPRVAWVSGLAVSVPVVLFNAITRGGFGSLVGVAISMVSAGIGYGLGRALGVGSTRSAR